MLKSRVISRYRLAEVWDLAQSPVGRKKLVHGALYVAWPFFARLAALHRRTFARRVRLVVVVGSLGKSTTTRAVTLALGRQPWRRMALNSYSMLAAAVLRVRPWQRHAAIEVGIRRPGEMAVYARLLRPDVVVVTSIASEHNRSLGTLENTRAEKARMVEALRPGGLAVLNGDDPHVLWMAGRTRARVRTFGFQPHNDVRAAEVTMDWPRGMRFQLQVGQETRLVRARLVGRHQLYSILAAVAVALEEGHSLDRVLTRLEPLRPVTGRLQPFPLPGGAWLLRDDCKGTAESFDAALDTLAEIPARRRLVVLGDIDEPRRPQRELYRRLGGRIASVATRAILVGRGPYAAGARRAGMAPAAFVDVSRDLARATAVVREVLEPGDVVLIKGRGEQKLARVALALAGRTVGCTIQRCHLMMINCDDCPMLERGWGSLPEPR